MGHKAKQKKKKSNTRQKQQQQNDPNNKIRNMIRFIPDDEVLRFTCNILTDEVMDKENFPNPNNIEVPTNEWLCQNMVVGTGEWGMAWFQVLSIDGLVDYENDDYDNFSKLSEGKKKAYLERMAEIVRRNRRMMMYKKWVYATHKKRKETALKRKDKADKYEANKVEECTMHEANQVEESADVWNEAWSDWEDDNATVADGSS